MAKHVVAAVGEIPPGTRKLAQVNGRAIVVFNLGGEFFALNNRCPHRGGSLHLGIQTGLVALGLAQADAELSSIGQALQREFPNENRGKGLTAKRSAPPSQQSVHEHVRFPPLANVTQHKQLDKGEENRRADPTHREQQ